MEEGFASGEAMARIAGKALKVIATVAGGVARRRSECEPANGSGAPWEGWLLGWLRDSSGPRGGSWTRCRLQCSTPAGEDKAG